MTRPKGSKNREYSDVMIPGTPQGESTPEPQAPATEGTIVVKQSELQRMANEIAESKIAEIRQEQSDMRMMEQNRSKQYGDWSEVGDKGTKKYFAKFKLWRPDTDSPEGLIVDWKHLRFDYDKNSRKHDKDIYKITLLYEDDSRKDVEMPLLVFGMINNEERVEIISTKSKELKMSQGKVRRSGKHKDGATMSKNVQDPGIDSFDTNDWVDLEVRRLDRSMTVKRSSGQIFEVKEGRLNA